VAELTPSEDQAELIQANARFYRAFESLDIGEMDQVWSHANHVRCIHPGWALLSGWDAVRESWDAIFKGSREMRFSIADVRPSVEGDLGWVTCTENILSHARGQVAVTSLLATNIFERWRGDWVVVHHHASHILGGGGSGAS
jgi:ketosteroid isomerase-like protein